MSSLATQIAQKSQQITKEGFPFSVFYILKKGVVAGRQARDLRESLASGRKIIACRFATRNGFGASPATLIGGLYVIISLFFSLPTFAVDTIQQFTVDIQEQYSTAKSASTKKKLPQTTERGGIYKQSLKLVQENGLVKAYEGVASSVKVINTDIAPGCGFTTQEMMSVIVAKPDIYTDLLSSYGELPPEISPWSKTAFTSCQKYYTCQGDSDRMTNQRFQTCINHLSTLYTVESEKTKNLHTLDQANYGDNIYFDGNADNASYDLLVDIQKISDVLYTSNKLPGETFFYEFPDILRIPKSQDRDPTDGFADADVSFDSNGIPLTGNNTQTGENTSTDGGTNTSGSTGVQSDILDFLDSNNNSQSGVSGGGQGLVQGNTCLLPGTNGLTESQTSTEVYDTYQDILNTYRDDLSESVFDGTGSILDDLDEDLLNAAFGNFLAFSTDFPSEEIQQQCMQSCDQEHTNEDGETDDLSWTVCVAGCCTSACNVYEGADRILCKSQCLCGEFGNRPSDTVHYKVRICRIAAEPKTIGPKYVMSVEEVIDEITNIVQRLVTEGRNLKHTTTREFMDSSMSANRFSDLFSFNAYVNIKPIRGGLKEKPQQDELEQKNKQLQSVALDTRGDMSMKAERNKYAIIYDDAPSRADTQQTQTFKGRLEEVESQRALVKEQDIDIQALTQSTQRELYGDKAQHMYDFLSVHQTMFTNLYGSLLRLQQTASDMEQKSR